MFSFHEYLQEKKNFMCYSPDEQIFFLAIFCDAVGRSPEYYITLQVNFAIYVDILVLL